MKVNPLQKFINYAEKMGDYTDGKCTVDVCHLDEVIVGAMLESYWMQADQLGMKDYKQALEEQQKKEKFEKLQQKLFND